MKKVIYDVYAEGINRKQRPHIRQAYFTLRQAEAQAREWKSYGYKTSICTYVKVINY